MENDNFTTYRAFVVLLRQLCEEKRSGTLFAATDANQMARIDLNNGQIKTINFMHKKGNAALSLLPLIQAGRARFTEGARGEVQGATLLPPSQEILDYLEKAQAPLTPSKKGEKAAFAPNARERTILEELMADFIGPVAAVICEEHFAEAGSLDALVAALAAEIGDGQMASRFIADARSRLAKG